MGSVALPASSQHRHAVATWSFEVTVVGSAQATDQVEPGSTLRFFSVTFGKKNFLFLNILLVWYNRSLKLWVAMQE